MEGNFLEKGVNCGPLDANSTWGMGRQPEGEMGEISQQSIWVGQQTSSYRLEAVGNEAG